MSRFDTPDGQTPLTTREAERLQTDGGVSRYRQEKPSLHEFIPPVEIDTLLDTIDEGVVLLDPDLRVRAVNDAVMHDTGAAEQDLIGARLEQLIETREFERIEAFATAQETGDSTLSIPHGALATVDRGHIRAELTFIARRQSAGPDGLMMVYRVTEGKTLRRCEKCRRERLGLVNQFNTTLRRVTRSIINPTSRSNLEQVVCSELAAASPYQFAVIMEPNPTTGGTHAVPRTWAGIDEESLSKLLQPIDDAEDAECPIADAMATGDIQVAIQINRNPVVAECLADIEMDVESVAVVPIRYEDTSYGVLAVYSGREGPFEDYELRMLEELGEIVGFAYNAVDKDELLSTDAVVELEFAIRDPASLLGTASTVGDCAISLESVVPTPDDNLLYYIRIEGGDPERLVDLATESPIVCDAELIRSQDAVHWAVFELTDRSVVEVLTANNVNVQEVTAHHGVARLVVEISPTADTETVVDILEDLYEDFELVSKRRRDRPAFTTPEFRHEVLDRLTTKQQNALEAAFQSGYFNRPRGATAEEIANRLDISSSTFHQHIRAAMSKLMTVLLETGARTQPRGRL